MVAVPDAVVLASHGEWTGYCVPEDRGEWHRLPLRLYDYWCTIAPSGHLPGRQHVVPEAIVPLWSRLWMLDVSRDPLRYRYRFCGTHLVRSFGQEVTGAWVDEAHPQLLARSESNDRFRFMVETGQATWRRGPPLWTHQPEHRTIETCLVPLATDGCTVDKLIGVSVLFDPKGRQI